jgi:hypothetical protein
MYFNLFFNYKNLLGHIPCVLFFPDEPVYIEKCDADTNIEDAINVTNIATISDSKEECTHEKVIFDQMQLEKSCNPQPEIVSIQPHIYIVI